MNNEFGFGQFHWFMGEVIDIMDPTETGRVKVKVFGKHTSEEEIGKEKQPWAIVANSTDSASTVEIGTLPHALIVGSQVVGFYIDGKANNVPMVLFSFPAKTDGKKDVSELARSNNTIKNNAIGYEPKSPYAAKYPNNKVTTTTANHIIEIDDTPGAERIHVRHKSGTYYQFYPNGDFVRKSVKDDYEIVADNQSIWVGGNVKEYIAGNYTLEVGGNMNVTIGKNYSVKVGSTTKINTGSSFSNQCGSTALYKSGGVSTHKASIINLN